MNIVLIGYRGTGKSHVGRLVGKRLKMGCVSMDGRIVEKAGIAIPEIVQRYGWPGFRDLESEVARELAGRDNLVIDTGGGVIERPENIEVLRANGLVVWLKASVAAIVARIQGGTERPALTAGKSFTEEVAEVLARRTPLYQEAAACEIDTDACGVQEVADQVVAFWLRRGAAKIA